MGGERHRTAKIGRHEASVRVLLFGASGQLGSALRRSLMGLGPLVTPSRKQCDLTRPGQLRLWVREVRPDIIVNAAAYTAVEKAQHDPLPALAINAQAPEVLADEAARLGALLVHYSTDYVFDGAKLSPYEEDDVPGPLNHYGQTKWWGEQALAASEARFLIFRTSGLYGPNRRNFVKTLMAKAGREAVVPVVADQWAGPTPAAWVAEATAAILLRYQGEQQRGEDPAAPFPYGTFHMAVSGQTSWFEFATEVLAAVHYLGRMMPHVQGRLQAIEMQQLGASVQRPAYSVLSTQKLQAQFGLTPPEWKAALYKTLERGPWPIV